MRILIISHFFPPLNVAGSRRAYSWAKYWSRWGNEIAVLTTRKTRVNGSLDLAIEPLVYSQIKIQEIPYWPFNLEGNPLPASRRPNSKPIILKFRNLLPNLRRSPTGWLLDSRIFWTTPAVNCAIKLHQNWPYQVIVSSFNPPASHIIASRLKNKLNAFWVADYRDLWFGNHEYHARGIFSIIEKTLEDSTVKEADFLTSVSEPLCKILESRFQKPVALIENGYDAEELASNSLSIDSSIKNTKVIIYTGTFYPEYNLDPLFLAINNLEEKGIGVKDRLKIIFYSHEGYLIQPLIKKFAVEKIVELPGYIDWDQALEEQKKADALLFLEWSEPNVDGILSSKIFEYMSAGKPILSIGSSILKAASKLIEQTGTGIYLGDSMPKIAETLKDLLDGKSLPYNPELSLIESFTREKQAKKMLDAIHQQMSAQSVRVG